MVLEQKNHHHQVANECKHTIISTNKPNVGSLISSKYLFLEY